MRHRLAFLIAGPLACGLLAAGCGSSGSGAPPVASISSSPSASATSSGGSARASMLAYARCMRAHGISDFPDPDAHGDLGLNGQPGSDLDPNNARFKAADAACKALRPAPQPPPKDLRAHTLKYSRCMRAHGISDFPDPKPDGTLQIQASPGSDLNANNPRFKAANDACKKYLPGGGAGGSLSTGGAS
jgi:hypothetical protein